MGVNKILLSVKGKGIMFELLNEIRLHSAHPNLPTNRKVWLLWLNQDKGPGFFQREIPSKFGHFRGPQWSLKEIFVLMLQGYLSKPPSQSKTLNLWSLFFPRDWRRRRGKKIKGIVTIFLIFVQCQVHAGGTWKDGVCEAVRLWECIAPLPWWGRGAAGGSGKGRAICSRPDLGLNPVTAAESLSSWSRPRLSHSASPALVPDGGDAASLRTVTCETEAALKCCILRCALETMYLRETWISAVTAEVSMVKYMEKLLYKIPSLEGPSTHWQVY